MLYKIFLIICILIILLLGFQKVLADDSTMALASATSPAITRNNEFNRIGSCESTGNPHGVWNYHAKNKYSTASGVFEFLWGTWNHYGKELWGDEFYTKNIWSEDNIELAWYVYNKYGTKDWQESSKCWKE